MGMMASQLSRTDVYSWLLVNDPTGALRVGTWQSQSVVALFVTILTKCCMMMLTTPMLNSHAACHPGKLPPFHCLPERPTHIFASTFFNNWLATWPFYLFLSGVTDFISFVAAIFGCDPMLWVHSCDSKTHSAQHPNPKPVHAQSHTYCRLGTEFSPESQALVP
eukprot:1177930-Prorocentrum_minimum.AAC.5